MPMANTLPRIAILGATGYVGRKLCIHLVQAGWEVTAITESSRALLLTGCGVTVLGRSHAAGTSRFDAVINLAYPTHGRDYLYREQNRQIFESVRDLVQPDGLVVHASTLVVFGADLEYPQVAGPIPVRRGPAYIESKLRMEEMLTSELPPSVRLEIVRFGNVWGPGSPLWTAGLARALIEHQPVAVEGQDGYSNITDVANICSLIDCLLRQPLSHRPPRFHHLAEHSERPWSAWTGFMGQSLSLPIRTVPQRPARVEGLIAELRSVLRSIPVGTLLRAAYATPTLGSYARTLIASLRKSERDFLELKVKAALARSRAPGMVASPDLLRLFSCPNRFNPHYGVAWQPPVSFEESLKRVREWLPAAGFVDA